MERKKFKTIEEEIEELILDAKLEVLEDVTDIHSDDHSVVEVWKQESDKTDNNFYWIENPFSRKADRGEKSSLSTWKTVNNYQMSKVALCWTFAPPAQENKLGNSTK